MNRLIAGLDITERLGNRRAIVSSVKGGKLYSTIYGTEYTPELLAQSVLVTLRHGLLRITAPVAGLLALSIRWQRGVMSWTVKLTR